MSAGKLVCRHCGSVEIQVSVWQHAASGEVLDSYLDTLYFCPECDTVHEEFPATSFAVTLTTGVHLNKGFRERICGFVRAVAPEASVEFEEDGFAVLNVDGFDDADHRGEQVFDFVIAIVDDEVAA